MEPVIKKSPYHHVMLMRDDKEIISFKVHSKVLSYSLIGGIILIGLGIAGTAFGIKSWQKNHSLRARYESASSELADARLQLEQLNNLQSLIASCEFPAPVFKFNEIQLPPESSNGAQQEGQGPTEQIQAEQAQAGQVQAGQVQAEQAPAEATNPAEYASTGKNSVTDTTPGEGTDNATAQGKENQSDGKTENSGDSSVALPITHVSSPVNINNLSSKTAGANRLQMSFDLVTNKPDAFVRGETAYTIELQDGTKHPIVPNFQDDTRFAISRMKNFDLTATLPEGVKGQQIKSVTVQVILDSGNVFMTSYPFAQ